VEFYGNGNKVCSIAPDKTVFVISGRNYVRIHVEKDKANFADIQDKIQKFDMTRIPEEEFREKYDQAIKQL
jgi:hypothetical protein